jgi:hypothetical protein
MDIGEAFFQARANHPARGGNRLILLDGQIQAGIPKDFQRICPRICPKHLSGCREAKPRSRASSTRYGDAPPIRGPDLERG